MIYKTSERFLLEGVEEGGEGEGERVGRRERGTEVEEGGGGRGKEGDTTRKKRVVVKTVAKCAVGANRR